MSITPTTLSRAAGVAAVGAGLIFIGVQINHPHLDAESITTTEVVVRNSLKALMAVLALVGITGMYLSQVRRNGLLGLAGYLVLGTGYLVILCTTFMAAYVLPSIAEANHAYVDDVVAATTGRAVTGDIGVLHLDGGLIFGVALYRARVLARWATALLAVGGVVTVALAVMPDAFYRFLAFPNGIAMIGLGYSLWSTARTTDTDTPSMRATVSSPRVTRAGAECPGAPTLSPGRRHRAGRAAGTGRAGAFPVPW